MSEKTEQATPKKQRDAREKGQVAKSPELGATLSLLFVSLTIMFMWASMLEQLDLLYDSIIQTLNRPFRESLINVWPILLETLLSLSLPAVFAAMLGGIVGHVMQVGFLFSMQAAQPSLEKLHPKNWFKKVFSKKGMFEILKTCLKVLLLGFVILYTVQDFIDPILKAAPQGVEKQFAVFKALFFDFMVKCIAVFAVVAAADYFIALKMHNTELMMTKDEVKREYKDMEGDPIIKSQRRQLQMELAQDTTLQQTRKATALVTNPTHIAVAIVYEEGEMPMPMVTAKGYGALAQKMRQIAEEEGIPIMRNVELARGLAEQCGEFEYIPAELIDQVVEVLLWVRQITGRE